MIRHILKNKTLTPLKIFKRALFVFPHPDDDLFFCGLIDILKEQECEIYFLWLSIGGLLPKTRKKEVSRISYLIGVPPENCFISNINDSMFWSNFESLASTIQETILKVKPDVLITTDLEGGHVDHDACFLICDYIARQTSNNLILLCVPTYHLCRRIIAVGTCNHEKKERYTSIKIGSRLCMLRIKFFINYLSQWYILFPLLLLGGTKFMTHQNFCIIDLEKGSEPIVHLKTLYKYFYPFQSIISSCKCVDFESIQISFKQFISKITDKYVTE